MLTAGLAVFAALAFASTASATTPGQNGRIVFGADATGSSQLYTVGPYGGRHQLTHVNGDAVAPDWSPNGRRIVFELDTDSGCTLIVMKADGSNLHALPRPPSAECDEQPSFTPDGGHIVFGRFFPGNNGPAIWISRANGTNQHRITTSPFGGTDPNVAPDGLHLSYVAFNGQDLGQGLIRTSNTGRYPKLLLPYSFDVAVKHDWSPNGRRIVFTNNADNLDNSANIGTVRPDGGCLRWLTHYTDPGLRGYVGGYSPDGRWIVFRLEDHGKFALMRMHPDGSHKRVILPMSDFRPRFIDWGTHS